MLQHGSIPVYDDQPLVAARALVHQGAIPDAATLADAKWSWRR